MNLSHKTAIGRNKPSKPIKLLLKKGLVVGRVLDFGCGRGFDADHFGFKKYDPYYFPVYPKGKYQTIICSYVLNVLPKREENNLIKQIKTLLKRGGKAFLTVRRDIKKEGYTPKGTYQRNVTLSFPVVYEDKDCCIYLMSP
jgi:hypothetical protein